MQFFKTNIKTSRIFFALLIIAVLIGLGFLFYTNQNLHFLDLKASKTTRIYFADNISHAHELLINQFNEEYKGKIEVVPVNLPFTKFSTNERKQLLAKSLRSKSDRIDVFAVDLIWAPRFARWAEPLNSYFSINERDQVIDATMRTCYIGEKLIAMPFYIDISLMYYREDLLAKLPNAQHLAQKLRQSITWEEFISLHQQNPSIYPFYTFAAKNFEGLICSFMEPLLVQKPDIFTADSLNLNIPEARKSLKMLVDFIHKYHMTPEEVTQFDETRNYAFSLDHDALFIRGWPGLIRTYQTLQNREKFKNLRRAALPHLKGYPPAFVFGGWDLMVSKFSTNKNAAVSFVKFLLRKESHKLMFEKNGYIPINKSVYQDSLFFRQNPELAFYRSLMEHGIHRPFLVNYTKISDVLSYYIYMAVKGDLSVEEALTQATVEINSPKTLVR